MMNLAGNKDCDKYIAEELRRNGIEVIAGPRSGHEVNASLTGRLGEFKFVRAWYYWVVSGPFPLEIAARMYESDPVWRAEVRASGHCAAPHPREQATHRTETNREILDRKNEAESRKYAGMPEGSTLMREIGIKILAEHDFADDPAAAAHHSTVDSFHVDSEPGLRLIADAIRSLSKPALSAEDKLAKFIKAYGAMRLKFGDEYEGRFMVCDALAAELQAEGR
jgi:hypothetical protein